MATRSVATPSVDRLAAEGVKLTRFYAASAVCTPTRVSVLTGKYPLRFDVRSAFRDAGEFLPLGTTLPKLLKQAGYRTAHVGKWHLGGVRLKDCAMHDRVPGPHEHGFDHYLTQIEEPPLRPEMGRKRILYRQGGTCLLRDDRPVAADDPYYAMHFTDILGEEAIRQIRAARDDPRPFFVNLWFLDPHAPYEPAPEPHWSSTAAAGISDDQHRFRSMVARMDYQVGRILKMLDELGLANNTLVLFTSDNGGAYEANNGDLKGGKTDLHEGGIRVPFLARWPGHFRAGTESAEIGLATDLMPTCSPPQGCRCPPARRSTAATCCHSCPDESTRCRPGPSSGRSTSCPPCSATSPSLGRSQPRPPAAASGSFSPSRGSRWNCSISRPTPASRSTGLANNPTSSNPFVGSSPPG